MPTNLEKEVARRRTFAIIAHPDAGKTTLTEKLLLFGGAIQLAGAVKARGEQRRARSDWMKVERERGISVTASVMTFDYAGCTFNLLDTPGHEDFSEDTYRTLTAVDTAVMVIDAAKGIESQTREAVRGLPAARRADHHLRQQAGPRGPRAVRPAGRDPADPGARRDAGLLADRHGADLPRLLRPDQRPAGADAARRHRRPRASRSRASTIRSSTRMLPADAVAQLRDDVEMARGLCPAFDLAELSRRASDARSISAAPSTISASRELLNGLAEIAPVAAAAADR